MTILEKYIPLPSYKIKMDGSEFNLITEVLSEVQMDIETSLKLTKEHRDAVNDFIALFMHHK